MPEMRFHIRWPSGAEESCYSPSLVIKDFLTPGATYALEDFLTRSREALRIASARVQARYGFPCSLADAQLRRIEAAAAQQGAGPDLAVTILHFEE